MAEIPEGTVTVLFTDLVDSTVLNQQLGDDEARSLSRAVERLVADRVDAHRGVPVKQLGDGVMAAFPSARRAVVCAREIQQAMHARNRREPRRHARMRIGLHTGEVITEDGDIHGETVIIAKRIEGLAPPGGVLASETVRMVLGSSREELLDRGEFELKGIAARWRLFEVPCHLESGTTLSPSEPTPYVGRTAERQRLSELVAAAQGGTGALVLISGEVGAGKSRLATSVLDEARQAGMNVFVGACLDMEIPPPYQPLVDQLDAAMHATTPERMRAALGENAPEVATLMPALRQRYDDIPEPPKLPADQERQYLLRGVEEFLARSTAVRPVVLVFEDLHWADESTLMLLDHLSGRLAHLALLVVGTYRPTDLAADRPLGRSLATLTRHPTTVEIDLQMLDRGDVAAMLAGRAGRDAPPGLVDLVFAETDGNPFFVEELFRHLSESGRLFEESGGWRSDVEIGETEVPRGVQRVIGRRLEQLSSSTRRILATASVVGRSFGFDTLAAVSSSSDDELFDALEEAEPLGLIDEVSGTHEARYQFVHEQIRQTLLGELSAPRRQRLHVRIADVLGEAGADTSATAAQIADHLALAGSAAPTARVVDALFTAAHTALDALAFEETIRHVERAMGHIAGGDVTQRSAALALEARALRGRGRVDDAFECLDRALADLSALGEMNDQRAAVVVQRCELLLDLFRAEPALPDLEEVLAYERRAGDRAAELEVLLALGRAHYIMSLDRRDHAEASRRRYEEALQLAEELDDRGSMARALIPTAWFTDYWTDYEPTAWANVERALALAEALDDDDLVIEARTARLHVLLLRDLSEEAEDLLTVLEQRRDPLRLKEHCFWMMWHYWAKGRYERCVEMCDRGIELAAQLGVAPVQYGSIKALALTEMGRFDDVEAALDQEVTDDAHPLGQAAAALSRTVYLDRIGATDDAVRSALDTYQRAVDLSRVWMRRWMVATLCSLAARMRREGRPVPPEVEAVLDATDVQPPARARAEQLVANGSPDAAIEQLEPTIERFDQRAQIHQLTESSLVLAEAHAAAGRPGEAIEIAQRGIEATERDGQASLRWQFRLVLALALEADGRAGEADAQREQAAAEVRALAARIGGDGRRRRFEAQLDQRRWGPW